MLARLDVKTPQLIIRNVGQRLADFYVECTNMMGYIKNCPLEDMGYT